MAAYRTIIFGAGNIGTALAGALSTLPDCEVTLADNTDEALDTARAMGLQVRFKAGYLPEDLRAMASGQDLIVAARPDRAVPEIARQFRVLANEVAGSSDAVIQSAFPIGQAELSELIATLEKRFGRKLEAKVQVTPELIGGVRVAVGDEVLDTSVKARLEQMKSALTA